MEFFIIITHSILVGHAIRESALFQIDPK